jgi:hypothetical protein
MRKLILALAALGVSGGLRAGGQGTTAANFLTLDTSPRAIAMGDAYTGLSDDVSGIEYNPAGTAYMTEKEISLMYASWFEDISYDYAALAWPIKNVGTIGADFFYLNAGTFQQWAFDTNGNPVQTGNFSAYDMYGTLSYSRQIVDFLALGMSIKFLQESISSYSASSVAATLGAYYKTPVDGLNLGFDVANLGPSEGFQTASSLPIRTKIGLGYTPTDYAKISMDYIQPIEAPGIWALGGEYGYRKTLYIRVGYQYQGAIDYNDTEDGYGPAAASGLNFGFGLKLFKHYDADYAYTPYGFLGSSQRISLSASWN